MHQSIIDTVFDELWRASEAFPDWPEDYVHAAAIVSEEAGELLQAANNLVHEQKPSSVRDMKKEAIQTAAMAVRFIINLPEEEAEEENEKI